MASQVHDFHVKDVFEEIYKHDENYGEPGRRPKRAPETGIDILIVGAGYSGLVAAMECWRKGHNVLPILERSEYPVCNGTQTLEATVRVCRGAEIKPRGRPDNPTLCDDRLPSLA